MSLEGSVTLDEVIAAVQAKRVPLAPELAGYLTLEIADAAAGQSLAVDTASVFIGEDGVVAVVRQKPATETTGDIETSVRDILVRLLDVSGSQTPALGATARRKSGNGLRALVDEVEAALIPVNRAAGRRALARLAREVKRVTHGGGRYAQTARKIPLESRGAAQDATSGLKPRGIAEGPTGDQPSVPRMRPSVRRVTPAPLVAPGAVPARSAPVARPPTPGSPAAAIQRSPRPPQVAPAAAPTPAPPRALTPPPARAATPAPPHVAPPPPAAKPGPEPDDEPPRNSLFEQDEVESLLATFEVAGSFTEKGVSTELKAMSGLDPTPPPPDQLHKLLGPSATSGPSAFTHARGPGDGVDELLALGDASGPPSPPFGPPVHGAPPPEATLPGDPPTPMPALSPAPPAAAPPVGLGLPLAAPAWPEAPAAIDASDSSRPAQDTTRKGARWIHVVLSLLALAVVGGAAAATLRFAPGFFSGRAAEQIAREKAEQERFAKIGQERAQQKCKVSLTVSQVPQDAEVLLRVGQAPADVERMPKGPRLEFVATAEGYAPRRVVILKDAPWETGPDGKARYELAVQLDPSKAKPGQQDPWPASEPGSEVGGTGQPGTVHIVGTPRGAELWLLAGVGPQAQIEQLRCDADVELLVAGRVRQRLKVTQKEMEAFPVDAAGIRPVKIQAGPPPK